jgi:hypothetical protein
MKTLTCEHQEHIPAIGGVWVAWIFTQKAASGAFSKTFGAKAGSRLVGERLE